MKATNVARTYIVETSPHNKDFGFPSLSSFGQFCRNRGAQNKHRPGTCEAIGDAIGKSYTAGSTAACGVLIGIIATLIQTAISDVGFSRANNELTHSLKRWKRNGRP